MRRGSAGHTPLLEQAAEAINSGAMGEKWKAEFWRKRCPGGWVERIYLKENTGLPGKTVLEERGYITLLPRIGFDFSKSSVPDILTAARAERSILARVQETEFTRSSARMRMMFAAESVLADAEGDMPMMRTYSINMGPLRAGPDEAGDFVLEMVPPVTIRPLTILSSLTLPNVATVHEMTISGVRILPGPDTADTSFMQEHFSQYLRLLGLTGSEKAIDARNLRHWSHMLHSVGIALPVLRAETRDTWQIKGRLHPHSRKQDVWFRMCGEADYIQGLEEARIRLATLCHAGSVTVKIVEGTYGKRRIEVSDGREIVRTFEGLSATTDKEAIEIAIEDAKESICTEDARDAKCARESSETYVSRSISQMEIDEPGSFVPGRR
jgi:hypothetical protein